MEEWQTPQLMVDGVTRDDIKQGTLGDCWFLSACAAVSQKKEFMKKVGTQNDKNILNIFTCFSNLNIVKEMITRVLLINNIYTPVW